jgi:hypothetical protein
MPLICYTPKTFNADKLDLIAKANVILNQYASDGYDLTLRQLYYQFVSKNYIPNSVKEYVKLGDLISDARLAGLVDWFMIVDRGRGMVKNNHWQKPSQLVEAAADQFATDKWDNQNHYVEVWVEKDSLRGIIARACQPLDVPHFSCRGYNSQSEMWVAAQRLLVAREKGKEVHIIHLGDHDPSGIDMSRDMEDRLTIFTRDPVHIDRIALNMNQIQQYDPPPNPAKITDSRYESYRKHFGESSWELDALAPEIIVDLIETAVKKYRNQELWDKAVKDEKRGKDTLRYIHQYFPEVVKFIRSEREKDDSPVICQGCGATQANPRCLCHDEPRPKWILE